MFEMRTETVKLFFLLLLVTAAFLDWRTKSIPVWFLIMLFVSGAAACLSERREVLSVLFAELPGLFLFLICRFTDGGLGIGDVWFVLGLGLFLSWQELLTVLALAVFQAALISLGIIASASVRGCSARGKSLPFLCFFPAAVLLVDLGGVL